MTDSTTHIDTLRVEAPEELAQQVQLRLSTTLGGADLHPPGLAPTQVLLVRELSDPEPGRLGLETAGAMLDRTWERAVRDALADCLRRAVRPTNGRVPPGADAVLFDDAAEAWACWVRARVAGLSSAAAPWWTDSLETSSDAPSSPAGGSPSVAAVWRARPRLVPALAAHLAVWDVAVEVVAQMAESEAETVLRAVCDAFDVPGPPAPEGPTGRSDDEAPSSRAEPSGPDDQTRREEGAPAETRSDTAPGPSGGPPWTSFVENVGGVGLADALAEQSPVHRQLLGVALGLHDRPTAVRSSTFQSAWQAWRTTVDRSSTDRSSPQVRQEDPEAPEEHGKRPPEAPDLGSDGPESGVPADPGEADRNARSSEEEVVSARADEDRGSSLRPAETAETGGEPSEDEPSWSDPYAATALGGVFYLVNVLDALDLPAAAATPPVGEHVGAWAVLEALARALLGPDDATLRSNDPLWRVLATLDNRRPEAPAGRNLDEKADAYRIPSAWLEAPHVDAPVDGQWAVTNDRLRVWTDLGCVADLAAAGDPDAQAEAAWERLPNTRRLQRAESADAMPLAPEPSACTPALALWAARAAPYVRHRLAAALGVDDRDAGWTATLFQTTGKLYTTDTHVDLVLPLDAARIDARVAGLDQSPGWWAAGGRVVRFHFRETDV